MVREDEICTGSHVALGNLYRRLRENSPVFWSFVQDRIRDEGCGYSSLLSFGQIAPFHLPTLPLLRNFLGWYKGLRFDFGNIHLQITLEDILYLTGLPIKGKAVLCSVSPDDTAFERVFGIRKISLDSTDVQAIVESEEDNNMKMKAILLLIIVFLIDPSRGSGHITGEYVQFVEKLDEVDQYAWGAALLCSLYYGLKPNAKNAKKIFAGSRGNHWITWAFLFLRVPALRNILYDDAEAISLEVPIFARLMNLYGIRGWDHNPSKLKLKKAFYLLDHLEANDVVMRPYVDVVLPPRLSNDVAFATYIGYIFCGHKVYDHRPHLLLGQFEMNTFTSVPNLRNQDGVEIKTNSGGFKKELHKKFALHLEHWNAAREHFRLNGRPHPGPDWIPETSRQGENNYQDDYRDEPNHSQGENNYQDDYENRDEPNHSQGENNYQDDYRDEPNHSQGENNYQDDYRDEPNHSQSENNYQDDYENRDEPNHSQGENNFEDNYENRDEPNHSQGDYENRDDENVPPRKRQNENRDEPNHSQGEDDYENLEDEV